MIQTFTHQPGWLWQVWEEDISKKKWLLNSEESGEYTCRKLQVKKTSIDKPGWLRLFAWKTYNAEFFITIKAKIKLEKIVNDVDLQYVQEVVTHSKILNRTI